MNERGEKGPGAGGRSGGRCEELPRERRGTAGKDEALQGKTRHAGKDEACRERRGTAGLTLATAAASLGSSQRNVVDY